MKKTFHFLTLSLSLLSVNSCAIDNTEAEIQENNDIIQEVKKEEVRDSFLPLVEDSYYYYEGSFDNKKIREKCTVKRIINKEKDTLYYFIDENQNIQVNIFGEGMYRHIDNNLMTTPPKVAFDIITSLEMSSTAYEDMLIPAKPKIGQSYEIHDRYNAWIKTVTIASFEDVEVIAGNFDNCLKIKIKSVWNDDGKIFNEQIWLKQGVGMIKWIRNTGRVDELVKYNIPE